MTIAIEKAAETYEDVAKDLNLPVKEVKEDSRKLLEDTYVDDGTTRGSRKEVERMIGVKLDDGSFSGTIPAMMKKVRLKFKNYRLVNLSGSRSLVKTLRQSFRMSL